MRTRTEIVSWAAVVVASVGLHAVAFGGLGSGRTDGFGRTKAKPTVVDFSVSPPKKAPPPPAASNPVAKAPRLALHPPHVKAAPAVSTPRRSAGPPPGDESPADFTGVTMTNDGPAAGWASATVNGEAMRGAVGRPGAGVTHRNVEGPGHPGPAIVAAADLSHPPIPPDLVDAVRHAYPAEARTKGMSGKALVRLRIAPDGRTSDTKLISESATGFGAACQAALRGSMWSPPVDRQGQAVATVVKFTCRFEVQ
jgi:TonB family protein